MYIQETYEYKDFIIEIVPDEDPFNPREDDGNVGTMVCWHRDLVLGDDFPSKLFERFKSWNFDRRKAVFNRWLNIYQKHLVILPLYIFNHSGITISTKPFYCPWDSWQVGWIYAPHNILKVYFDVKELTSELIEETRQLLIQEVKTYDDYLTGNVWGFLIKNKNKKMVDCCFGFWGDEGLEECQNQARLSADAYEKQLMPLFHL
ncbi:MAG: hypothetical protein KME49_22555 [Brasilonema octagenarum HA4186-MV1]|jgi:hypothetical protein|nr:hypothetical protein [Brasilonema octagenarum HA4186-MV1]